MCVIIDSSNSKGDGSMKFIISGKNITVTEGLKTAVQDKLSKLERYFTPDTEVVVTLSVQKVTVQNLEVVKIDAEQNLILVKGAIPGNKGGLVTIRNSVKA